jgi:hypothetical protein
MKLFAAGLVCTMIIGLSSSFAIGGAEVPANNRVCDCGDGSLDAARKFVESSDKYMHQSKLKRGDKGYGLTVFVGTDIVKFDVEIVSVLTNWGPHQDVILAKLAGHDLEKTGIIAGMSGSPVYIHDTDGKDKLIGAVAYGWRAQKDPLCGIQPITQMLAMSGVLETCGEKGGATAPSSMAVPPVSRTGVSPVASSSQCERNDGSAEHGRDAHATHGQDARATATAYSGGAGLPAWASLFHSLLDPHKIDFTNLPTSRKGAIGADSQADSSASDLSPALTRLSTPLMISGMSSSAVARAGKQLAGIGMVPVQAGGVGSEQSKELEGVKLAPGSAVAVPLCTGDADWYAVGTVTAVIGDRVLAFGHAFNGSGKVQLPMATAYIHTVVSGVIESFKLASTGPVKGVLDTDEQVGIGGTIGKAVSMIPMTVTVNWAKDDKQQIYKYNICRDRVLTPALVGQVLADATTGWHDMPEEHTVRHTVKIDFGKLGTYEASNVSSLSGDSAAKSDLVRPIAAMLNNPMGTPPDIAKIDVELTIETGITEAKVEDLRLDGHVYKPGQTIEGSLLVKRFRLADLNVPVKFKLPDDLPEGTYTLKACDYTNSLRDLENEMPQRFDPKTLPQLLDMIKTLTAARSDAIYLRLPLARTGLALGTSELPDLPESKARIMAQSQLPDMKKFSQSLVQSVKTGFPIDGCATAEFKVENKPQKRQLTIDK